MTKAPIPIAKRLLGAKLVMGTAVPAEIVASARYYVTSGDVSPSAQRLAAMGEPAHNEAVELLRSWLREDGMELPSPDEAQRMIFDFYFAAAALGPQDPTDGIRDFLSNVVFPQRVARPDGDENRTGNDT